MLGGLALGFVPGLPSVPLDPGLVLAIFLPPLLYWESVTAPTDVMLANAGQIGMLAIGLVLATTLAVAAVMHAVANLPWGVAFVLGAVVAPTDELASAPVLERLRMPRHVIAIVGGESLVNDALSLVLYAAAVAAVTTGAFHLAYSTGEVFVAAAGAVLLGWTVARLAIEGWRRITDAQLQGVISLIVPFLAFIPAQRLGVSAVLSVVTTGVYVNRFTPLVMTPAARLQITGFWDTFVFVANAALFLLVGLQLHAIASVVLRSYSWLSVLGYALAVNAVIVAVRFAWVLLTEYLPLVGGSSEHASADVKHAVIVAWSGLRGAVSLAAALAIPLTVAGGAPFPHRELVIFLTFTVILVTLVAGGLTLPLAIRALAVADDGSEERKDLDRAVEALSHAALETIDRLERDGRLDPRHAWVLRRRYEPLSELRRASGTAAAVRERRRSASAEHEVIEAQRAALVALRERGEIDNAVLRRIQRSLDLAESRLDPGEA